MELAKHPEVQQALKVLAKHAAHAVSQSGGDLGSVHVTVGFTSRHSQDQVKPLLAQHCVPDLENPGQFVCH